MHQASRWLIPIVLMAVGLGIAFWYLDDSALRPGDEPPGPVDRAGRSSSPALRPLDEASSPATDEAPRDEPGSDVETVERWRGSGTIRLRFRDVRTGEAIPRLPFVVFAERGQLRVLGRGRSDEYGRATLRRLPADAILIETSRKPPWASSLAAIWLEEGREREQVVEVGHGGTVRGRTVDDLGAPLADVEIFGWNGAGPRSLAIQLSNLPELMARSDATGHFEVGSLQSRPRGVWVVDDRPRPERFEDVRLHFEQSAHQPALRDLAINHEREIDLGDVVLPRFPSYRGRVIDARGQPVAGARISADSERGLVLRVSTRQGKEEWVLKHSEARNAPREYEAVSDLEGRFLLEDFPFDQVEVFGPTGITTSVALPTVEPGEIGEIEIRLEEKTRLLVLPVDEKGEPWGRKGRHPRLSFLRGYLELSGRTWVPFSSPPEGDGTFVIQGGPAPQDVRSITLRCSGWSLAVVDLPSGAETEDPIWVTLQRTSRPALRLLVESAHPEDRANLSLEACLSQEPRGKRDCCNLGGSRRIRLVKEPVETEIEVDLEDRPYFLHVSAHRTGLLTWTGSFGPFIADESRHRITLPDWKPNELELGIETEPEEPPAPREPEMRGQIQVFFRDAETLKPITGAHLDLIGRNDVKLGRTTLDPGILPGAYSAFVRPGKYELEVRARGYVALKEVAVIVLPGEQVDLGIRELEPLRAWRGRLVGLSLAELDDLWCSVTDGTRPINHEITIDGTGRFVLEAESLPEKMFFELQTKSEGQRPSRTFPIELPQIIEVGRWDPIEEKTVEVLPWFDLEVQVLGIAPRHQNANLLVTIEDLDRPRLPTGLRDLPPVDGQGSRIYSFRAPAGRYRVSGEGVLYRFPLIEVTLSADDVVPVIATAD